MSSEKMRYGYARHTTFNRDLATKMHTLLNQGMWYEENMPLPSDEYSEHAQYTDALSDENYASLWHEYRQLENWVMKQRQLYNARKRWQERQQNREPW